MFAIFVSAGVALYETIQRFIHLQQLTHLWVLAAAGLVGFAANEIAAQVRPLVFLREAVEEGSWGEHGDRAFECEQMRVSAHERCVRVRGRCD